MRDTPLIVAHLLGGTSGLNLQQNMSDEGIEDLVAQAIRIAVEIEKQVAKLPSSFEKGPRG